MNNNKNTSHLTHEMKKEHGGLAETSMKAHMESKWHELADTRAEMREEKEKRLEIKEESMARERESFERSGSMSIVSSYSISGLFFCGK